ncbi:hypothetical protein VA596_41680 [Amycolatopsis sp., V23-08]|uniref:Zinc ribbon domain-containing protein n=1 Tax=Amycolatopsis heterodermiae TaxID=3110235 RepID=A0ABU5RII6_9PSEU|nr:hypothetical protein [Amycolatopsis sp., V23-08]MEA5366098.1 hypothetical protein [Amycolatopsis sp., V23-08]
MSPAGDEVGAAESPAASGGSWYGLVDIASEAVQKFEDQQTRAPVACQDCGEPLRTGPNGENYCPFDGSIWGPGPRRIGQISNTHN